MQEGWMKLERKPNIIFLLEDQQQAQAIEDGHFCITPNIRELKRDSIVCGQAHTCNAICSPSRASLITGVLPHRHGMVDCAHAVPPYRAVFDKDLDTLPQALKDSGYQMSYYGKWHIERSGALERFGFDEYETEMTIPKFQLTPVDKVTVHTPEYSDKIICGVFAEDSSSTEEAYIYGKAMDFIERSRAGGKPWCTFISTYAPHDPYSVPKEVFDLYKDVEIPLPESFGDRMKDKPAIYRRLQSVWKDLTEEEAKMIIRCYYSYCTLVDIQVGRLTEYLKRTGQYDNTLIVYLSDHGDLMGAHGLFCKGVPAFEEIYHIPLFFKMPQNRSAGSFVNQYVSTQDIAPTVLEIAGCRSLDGEIHGESVLPWLLGEVSCGRTAFAEFFGQRFAYTQRIFWKGPYKYVFNTFDYDEFYNLEEDPHELVNEIHNERYQEVVREMAQGMWTEMKRTGDVTMTDAEYYVLRFAPVGPGEKETSASYSIYNKVF